MSAGCVILAAGGSARLGQPKQLVRLAGETLLDRAVRVAREAGCSPVVVVLGSDAERISAGCALETVETVFNPDWADGMAGSIRVGIAALAERVSTAVVMACDQPAVDAAHLRRLIELCGEGTGAVASQYSGRNGVPACFHAGMFAELMGLAGDRGARGLLSGVRSVALAGGELDVDTPESLERMRSLFGG